jgi:hypothetical protein
MRNDQRVSKHAVTVLGELDCNIHNIMVSRTILIQLRDAAWDAGARADESALVGKGGVDALPHGSV